MIFVNQLKDLAARIGVAIKNLSISDIGGLVAALAGKVDDSQVRTDVPEGALFTDTDTLQSVTSKGSSTNRDITVNGIVDQITNIGKTGDVSRAQIQSYFPEGGGPEKWAEIPIGTRLFIYNGDIPDSYNPPENKGVFHKISHADSAGRWTGMYYPISDYHNNIYIGQGSNSQNPTWAKLWTDRTLTEVSQLINDAGYLVNADKYDDTIIQSEVTDNTDARHSHLNKTTLDSFGENVNGLPTYNGVKVDTTIAQRDVYDGLNSTDNTISLAANRGKELKDVQDTQQTAINLNTAKVGNVAHPLVETAVPVNALFTDTIYDDSDVVKTVNNIVPDANGDVTIGSSLLTKTKTYTSGAQTITADFDIVQVSSLVVGNSFLQEGTQYTVSGAVVTITDTLTSGAVIQLKYWKANAVNATNYTKAETDSQFAKSIEISQAGWQILKDAGTLENAFYFTT